MKKQGSPIKVKDYFANPIHKIKQPAFISVGFNQSTLNTFVKNFTNRYSTRYISYSAVKQFIKSFTNNSPKLIQTYQLFFQTNFKIGEDGNILLQQFIDFFTREAGQTLAQFDDKSLSNLYKDLSPITVQSIMERCEQVGVAMTEKQAKKIITMLNKNACVRQLHSLQQGAFLKGIKESFQ